jgi:type IV pilus assembly protein PilY1
MADYTAYPVFLTQTVTPNILVMLDNSGSMNFNAYGSYPGDYGIVSDAPYGSVDVRVRQSEDDSEEQTSNGYSYYNHTDLDLGDFSTGTSASGSIVGVRFQNVSIPQGAKINSAYIEFTAYDADTETTDHIIYGEAVDHATQFTTATYDISGRSVTSASVSWAGEESWVGGTAYLTPDVSTIVQEIVDREGWGSDNAMVFMIKGAGKRDAMSYDYSSSNAPRLVVEYDPVDSEYYYYGYFDPTSNYSYSSNVFSRDSSGPWSGNWLNWLCMRRIDILRKVLVGGLATSRTGGGNTTIYGETPAQSSRVFKKVYDGTEQGGAMTPYNDGVYTYVMQAGYIRVYDSSGNLKTSYSIVVDKDVANEPDDFYEGNVAGVMQRVGDKAYWGNEWFNSGSGKGGSGGTIANRVGTNMTTLITDLQNTSADTSTPLAEAYYVASQYFKQKSVASGYDYPNLAIGSINATMDPYYHDADYIPCAKSFVILLTDGASTMDSMVPSSDDLGITTNLKDYDGDGDKTSCSETSYNCDYGSGSDYLDDLALYARTVDLRSDLDGDQNLILYTIYAFGEEEDARSLLRDAARNGGFDDRNGNGVPDGTYTSAAADRLEWDKDGDAVPDTYYEASDGYTLESELLRAITDILQRAASGTSASVLSTNREGEGNMVQAYFRPSVTVGTEEVLWTGYLQALWIDEDGNLREDTDGDHALDTSLDRWVEYYQDTGTGDTRIRLHDLSDETLYDEVDLEEVTPIWEAGKRLHARDPDDRKIFTFLDKDSDGTIDETSYDATNDTGEMIRFALDTADQLKPYLGVKDATTWDYLGTTSHDDRVDNLISYIRGTDMSGLRTRTMTVDGVSGVWKLGDIVSSTPVTVAAPKEEFDNLYEDQTYEAYYKLYEDRETVIIAGANDGMLHAFTSWVMDTSGGGQAYVQPTDATGSPLPEEIGDEIWAYIPQTLLPHLKWLADPDYTHVYYADQEPFVMDARIFTADATHPNGWGTVLIVGLNMGGKYIWSEGDYDDGTGTLVTETRDFNPTYICMDVTEPRNPQVLWEKTYDGLGMSSGIPGILKVGRYDKGDTEKWYAVIGSGYTAYDGTSDQPARIYAVDLGTGEPYTSSGNDYIFTGASDAYFNRPITLDADLSFETDAAYLAENYAGKGWESTLYRLSTWDSSGEPSLDPAYWNVYEFFESSAPITAPISLGTDAANRVWVYFGTGRFVSDADKIDTQLQYLLGVKDPLFNVDVDAADKYDTLDITHLLDVTDYLVMSDGSVYPGGGSCITWAEFLDQIKMTSTSDTDWTHGWYRELETGTPSERCISKPTLVSGSLIVPTYIPSADICELGGETYMFAMYYETGTAYYKVELIAEGTGAADGYCGGSGYEHVVREHEGSGAPPSRSGAYLSSDELKAFLQKSTGEVVEIGLDTAIKPKSELINWMEK